MFKIRKQIFLEMLALTIISIAVISNLSERIYAILFPISVVAGIILFIFTLIKFRIQSNVLVIYAIAIMTIGANVVIVREYGIESVLMILIIYPAVALFLVYTKKLNTQLWLLVCCVLVIFIMYHLFRSEDYYHVFYQVSRNYVSIYLLILMSIVSIVLSKINREVPFWVICILYACCIIAVGRGGIIAGTFLFAAYLIYHFFLNKKNNAKKKNRRRILGIVLISIGSFSFMFNSEYILNTYFSRFISGEYVTSSNYYRMEYIKTYLRAVSHPMGVIFGANTRNLSIYLIRSGGNLHNSYLMMHAYAGIIGEAALLMGIFIGIKRLFKSNEIGMALIFSAFFIRALFDYALPAQLGDVIVWYLIFYVVEKISID